MQILFIFVVMFIHFFSSSIVDLQQFFQHCFHMRVQCSTLYNSLIWVNWPLRFNISVNNNVHQHAQHSPTPFNVQALV